MFRINTNRKINLKVIRRTSFSRFYSVLDGMVYSLRLISSDVPLKRLIWSCRPDYNVFPRPRPRCELGVINSPVSHTHTSLRVGFGLVPLVTLGWLEVALPIPCLSNLPELIQGQSPIAPTITQQLCFSSPPADLSLQRRLYPARSHVTVYSVAGRA